MSFIKNEAKKKWKNGYPFPPIDNYAKTLEIPIQYVRQALTSPTTLHQIIPPLASMMKDAPVFSTSARSSFDFPTNIDFIGYQNEKMYYLYKTTKL